MLKEAARHPASPANFEPLPSAVIRDLEAIRKSGRPERQGMYLVGDSELILGIPLVGFAICFVVAVVYGIIDNVFGEQRRDYRDVFLVGFAISFAVGFVLFLLARLIQPFVFIFLNARAGGNRLLSDRRVFMYMAEEGLVWHDPFGLRYVPWKEIAAIALDPGTKEKPACLTFSDRRTAETLSLHAALMFKTKAVKAIHAEMLKRAPAS